MIVLEWEETYDRKRSPASATGKSLGSIRMSEYGSQSPSAFNETSHDDSVFERDDSLIEDGNLSEDTSHQFSVLKRSNLKSTNQTIKTGYTGIIQLMTFNQVDTIS